MLRRKPTRILLEAKDIQELDAARKEKRNAEREERGRSDAFASGAEALEESSVDLSSGDSLATPGAARQARNARIGL
jgi:hypothetical protein